MGKHMVEAFIHKTTHSWKKNLEKITSTVSLVIET